jgi:beta-xylosidase
MQIDEDTFVMYFVVRRAIERGGVQCIGVARSDNPLGPFRNVGDAPFICQVDLGGSIDPSSFVDEDGTRYVLWKNDGNCCGLQTWLFIQEVSPDGLTLVGEPTPLIRADQAWEGILVEAPTLWRHEDRYYLFYSANSYQSPDYAIGYAVADDILGPYEKPSDDPLFETTITGGIIGPGGQDIVVDDAGETWMLYHKWEPGTYRSMNLIRLEWNDGVPSVSPTRGPQPVPQISSGT